MNKVLTRNCAGDGQVYLDIKQRGNAVHADEIGGRDKQERQTGPAEPSSPITLGDN